MRLSVVGCVCMDWGEVSQHMRANWLEMRRMLSRRCSLLCIIGKRVVDDCCHAFGAPSQRIQQLTHQQAKHRMERAPRLAGKSPLHSTNPKTRIFAFTAVKSDFSLTNQNAQAPDAEDADAWIPAIPGDALA